MSNLLTFTSRDQEKITVQTLEVAGLIEKETPSDAPTTLILKCGTKYDIRETWRLAYVMWDDALNRVRNHTIST